MKKRYLLVDGHSVIFQWQGLASLHARQPEQARHQLTRILRDYQDASDYEVVVVFDGKGVSVSQSAEKDEIQVFYSKSGQSADAIIERLTAKYAKHYEITVATDDNLERQTVTSFGGQWISTDHLLDAIEDASQSLNERIEKNNMRRR